MIFKPVKSSIKTSKKGLDIDVWLWLVHLDFKRLVKERVIHA
jgi:hypothetical protein